MADVKPYFYIHDRLGSVRLVVDGNGAVQNSYTYDPFGQDISAADCAINIYNPFKFTGQWFDDEISQYYLRARMYDPALMRFTGRDPVEGKQRNPLSLHPYLYCQNNSVNATDPNGEFLSLLLGESIGGKLDSMALAAGRSVMGFATRVYTAAWVRAVEINLMIWGVGNGYGNSNAITGYTRHGINAAISRNGVGVSPQAILNATSNPVSVIPQANGSIRFVGEDAVVVLNEYGEVITTWARSSSAWR